MSSAGHHSMMQKAAGGGLPSSYTEVEYIYPSAAGAYIDLGWYPTTWTAFDAWLSIAPLRKANFGVSDIVPTSTNSQQNLNLGFSLAGNWSQDRWLGFSQNGTYEWNGEYYSYAQYTSARNNVHHHYVDLDNYVQHGAGSSEAYRKEYYIDDSLIATGYWDNIFPVSKQTYSYINRDVFLFALNVNGSAAAAAVTKCGRLRFYNAQGDAANFIPCINENLNAGMFNLVSQTFHGAATGTILYQALS